MEEVTTGRKFLGTELLDGFKACINSVDRVDVGGGLEFSDQLLHYGSGFLQGGLLEGRCHLAPTKPLCGDCFLKRANIYWEFCVNKRAA